MTLYLLRHGEADWPDWDQPDEARPLTEKGKKEMRRVAHFLHALAIAPSLILTSPLPRARQTAEIVARGLKLASRDEDALRPGFDAAKLKTILKRNSATELMLVGHEPDFSAVVRALTGGSVKLAKAGIARVELEPDGTAARLFLLLSPKVMRAARQTFID